VILVDSAAADENKIMETALEAGADDVREAGTEWEIVTDPSAFEAVKNGLTSADITPLSAEVTMVPQNTVAVDGSDAKAVLRMMEALEDHDDVQAVYANFDIPESVLADVG
jgi:transcriptional/translational regulatory protein YebC/TACO1